MKISNKLLLVLYLFMTLIMKAEEPRFFMRYKFMESDFGNYDDGRYGISLIGLDSVQKCYAFFYKGIMNVAPIRNQQIKDIVWTNHLDSSHYGDVYYGQSSDGLYFVEKIYNKRSMGEGIIFYQVPESSYMELLERLNMTHYLPLELFRNSLINIMGYKMTGVFLNHYEEGIYGGALVTIDSARSCYTFYFNGAMMSTPLYHYQVKAIEYVNRVDSLHYDDKYFSPTGIINYGKASDGTYFAEKLFYKNPYGVPQGIIFFKIPENYIEEILRRLCLLAELPIDLFR